MDFTELKADIKDIKSDVVEIKQHVAKNTVSLDHHIKRTDLNEERIQKIEYWLLGLLSAVLVAVMAAYLRNKL